MSSFTRSHVVPNMYNFVFHETEYGEYLAHMESFMILFYGAFFVIFFFFLELNTLWSAFMFIIWKRAAEYKNKNKNYMSKRWTLLSEKCFFCLIGVRVLVAGQALIVERMWRNVLPLPAWTEHIVWSLTSQESSPAHARPSLPASSVNRPTTPATCGITPACTTLPAVPSQMKPPSVFAQSVRYSNPTASYLLTHPPAGWDLSFIRLYVYTSVACFNSLAFHWVGYSGKSIHFLLITSLLDTYFSPH